MPITGMFWRGNSNQDIHVLRGHSSRDLTHSDLTQDGLRFRLLDGTRQDADDYLANNNDVVLTFQPLFKGAAAGGTFSGQGIEVDMSTGEVTVEALPRPLPKNNFIIVATATNAADHSTIATETIRVHIHTSVTAFALTPQTLTVRPAATTRADPELTHYRFALRAMFDDGTMGDLTENHGVTWEPASNVDSDTGRLIVAASDAANDTITITATLPADFGGGNATGRMQIGQAWRDDPNMPVADIVVGGGWPGTTLPDKAPNVLFLGDGFMSANKSSFMQSTNTVVHHLKTDRLVRPYDLLCTSMNFWRAFMASDASGISFRCEIYTFDRTIGGTSTTVGRPVPPPEQPPANGNYKLGHLIYAAGLPVPADGAKAVADLRSDWAALVDNLPDARVPNSVIEQWKRLATRTFVEELDNFPGMAFGEPPAANADPGTPMLDLHPRRSRRDGLDRFLTRLASVSGVTFGPSARIGSLWATPSERQDSTDYELRDVVNVTGNNNVVFVCTTAGNSAAAEPAGYAAAQAGATIADGTAVFQAAASAFDNAGLVVVCSSFNGGRAQNVTRTDSQIPYVVMSMETGITDIPLGPPVGGMGFSLNYTEIPTDVSIDTCRAMAHELGHSFGLGDEYVDFERPFAGSQADLDDADNLQTEADTRTGAAIDGNRIRWNWHRIRNAGVIRAAITDLGGGAFRIPVVAGDAARFSKDDTVLLRLRRPGHILAKATDVTVSKTLQIAIAPSASASADYLVVQAAPGVAVTLAELQIFVPDSIVFKPVPAPDSVRSGSYPFAEMVAKNVKDLISTDKALYRRPANASNRALQYPNLDGLTPGLPGRPFCFKEKPRIVGLYEGGELFASGIFHPTGTCMMRTPHSDTAEFCTVCRYVLVDLINPRRHFEIDRDYDDIYPLK